MPRFSCDLGIVLFCLPSCVSPENTVLALFRFSSQSLERPRGVSAREGALGPTRAEVPACPSVRRFSFLCLSLLFLRFPVAAESKTGYFGIREGGKLWLFGFRTGAKLFCLCFFVSAPNWFLKLVVWVFGFSHSGFWFYCAFFNQGLKPSPPNKFCDAHI